MINPTIKKEFSASPTAHRSLYQKGKQNPASTLKFKSYVDKRREEMEDKKFNDEVKMN